MLEITPETNPLPFTVRDQLSVEETFPRLGVAALRQRHGV
jgi:hypothetical protein